MNYHNFKFGVGNWESRYFYDLDLIIYDKPVKLKTALRILRRKRFTVKPDIYIGLQSINYNFDISYKTYSSEDLFLNIDGSQFNVKIEWWVDRPFTIEPVKNSMKLASKRLSIYFNFLLNNIHLLPPNRKDWNFQDLHHNTTFWGQYLQP